jgi:two-component system chemotaxis sensor kinase CheA
MAVDNQFDDEVIGEYLAECREHLATIESDLMAMEKAGSSIDEQVVNRVFRAAHSIKGGAGFFDLSQIRRLAHKTESILDLIRGHRMTPTPESISILLLCFDKLREMIDDHRASNGMEIDDYLASLDRLASPPAEAQTGAAPKAAVEVEVPAAGGVVRLKASAADLERAARAGQTVYLLQFDLIHDLQRAGRTPYALLRSLMDNGEILETAFDFDSAGTLLDEGSNCLMLDVLLASEKAAGEVGEICGIAPDRISAVQTAAVAAAAPVVPFAVAPITVAPEAVAPEAPAALIPPIAAPAAAPAPPGEESASAPASPVMEATVRLNVSLLDSLMTLAGELVLSRNQLNEAVSRRDERGIRSGTQRISLVTSELQEVVTLTRMQPVSNVFGKFPRIVRDMSRTLGKQAEIRIEGGEVEIDKTILEGLSDPLTHMVRNAVDHGLEKPDARLACGKPAVGTVLLKAYHQAGQVVIEVSDDGKGLDASRVAAACVARGVVTREQVEAMSEREQQALILLPGVSTAEKLSDISGRGVGMDVVKTNLDKLGGKIEIDSMVGHGTSFRIKLPLTLAIIPSLLVSDGGERFAIPQVNVGEMIRIPASQIQERIDRVGEADVLILRDRLVPLLRLSDALRTPRYEPEGKALNVVLVDTGVFEYGLVVEELHDTVEIVVKPLGRHFRERQDYAGATILGDGRVAVILDVAGLAAANGLSAASASASQAASRRHSDLEVSGVGEDTLSLLVFQNAPAETCAMPIEQVSRVERIRPAQLEQVGGRRTMQYRGATLPVIALSDAASVGSLGETQPWVVVVCEQRGRTLGLLAAEPLDMVETSLALDRVTLRQTGIAGSAILKQKTTLLLDINELASATLPDWAPQTPSGGEDPDGGPGGGVVARSVLVAEDSDFFRGQLRNLIEAAGYTVLAAEDGEEAWKLLDGHAGEVAVVATDVEMPRLSGLGLARRIRADGRFRDLPVIALSALADEDEIARGLEAGATEYQIKLNKDNLLESIHRAMQNAAEPMPGVLSAA